MSAKFYTYFRLDQAEESEKFANELIKSSYEVTRKILDYDGGQWSVIAEININDTDEMYKHEEIIESIANKYGGEYDGNEVGV